MQSFFWAGSKKILGPVKGQGISQQKFKTMAQVQQKAFLLGMTKTEIKKWEIVVTTFLQNVLDITLYYYHNNEKFLRIVGALEPISKRELIKKQGLQHQLLIMFAGEWRSKAETHYLLRLYFNNSFLRSQVKAMAMMIWQTYLW